MADDGGSAAPSGRGGGRAGARKFMPTMPGRRKRADEGGGAAAAVDAAASDETFKDLIKQAQSAGAGGRGRGRGRFGQQRFQVTFGNFGEDRPALLAAKQYPRSAGGGASGRGGGHGHGGGGGGGGGGGSGGGGGRVKAEDGGDVEMADDLPDAKPLDAKYLKPRAAVLDYNQYYPTMLPLRLPGQEIWEEDSEGAGFQPSSLDLAVMQDVPQQPAVDLDLFDPEVEDQMFLMQMPAVMPLQQPQLQPLVGSKGGEEGGGGAGPGPGSERRRREAAAQAQGRHVDVRDMPSGRIGKLLVFKSGKVKLQVGDVLMDVSVGLPNQHRQDVVAINPTSHACVLLGDVHQRVLVSPDVLDLLAREQPPEFRRAPEELAAITEAHRRARGYDVVPRDGGGGGEGAAEGAKIKAERH